MIINLLIKVSWITFICLFYILGKSRDVWTSQVVESAAKIVKSFLSENGSLSSTFGTSNDTGLKTIQRDLWTQYICKVWYVLEAYLNRIINYFTSILLNAIFMVEFTLFSALILFCHLFECEKKGDVNCYNNNFCIGTQGAATSANIMFSYEFSCWQACGDRVLRGLHEWEQHKQGRGHRKRISSLKKSKAQAPGFVQKKVEYSECEQWYML